MRTAYNMGSNTGAGQVLALIEFSGYNPNDISTYFRNIGQINNVPIANISVDGANVTSYTNVNNEGEVCLDIEQAVGVAPGLSSLQVYISSGFGTDGDILNKIVTDNTAKQISNSWYWYPDDPSVDEPYFEEAAAQGQSIFSVSGDKGAYAGSDSSDESYPAEDSHVTTVGGTDLQVSSDGTWASETTWINSGGGPANDGTTYFAIPSWQASAINASNQGSTTLRNAPDVALQSDYVNYICYNGSCSTNWGGTSFATPRWAAYLALVNQQLVFNGKAAGLGFLNPTLYQIGQSARYNVDFHDIVIGNTRSSGQSVYWNAVTGYDLVTGWGSMNGANLMTDLLATSTIRQTITFNPISSQTVGGALTLNATASS
jgi:kumamolisin